jgi:hypothetical protein
MPLSMRKTPNQPLYPLGLSPPHWVESRISAAVPLRPDFLRLKEWWKRGKKWGKLGKKWGQRGKTWGKLGKNSVWCWIFCMNLM